jgi:hypothetical protein
MGLLNMALGGALGGGGGESSLLGAFAGNPQFQQQLQALMQQRGPGMSPPPMQAPMAPAGGGMGPMSNNDFMRAVGGLPNAGGMRPSGGGGMGNMRAPFTQFY